MYAPTQQRVRCTSVKCRHHAYVALPQRVRVDARCTHCAFYPAHSLHPRLCNSTRSSHDTLPRPTWVKNTNIANMDIVHNLLLTHLHQLLWNCPYRLRVRGHQWSAWGGLKKNLPLQHLPGHIWRRRAHLCFGGPSAPPPVLEGGHMQLQREKQRGSLMATQGAYLGEIARVGSARNTYALVH